MIKLGRLLVLLHPLKLVGHSPIILIELVSKLIIVLLELPECLHLMDLKQLLDLDPVLEWLLWLQSPQEPLVSSLHCVFGDHGILLLQLGEEVVVLFRLGTNVEKVLGLGLLLVVLDEFELDVSLLSLLQSIESLAAPMSFRVVGDLLFCFLEGFFVLLFL